MRVYATFLLPVFMVPFSRGNGHSHTIRANTVPASVRMGRDAIIEERLFVAASHLRGGRTGATGARAVVEVRVCCRGTLRGRLGARTS